MGVMDMFARSLLVAAVVVAFSSPAFAFYCPKQAKAIDAALSTASLSAAQKAEATALSTKGLALHGSGDHTGAVKSLAAATRIILGGM